MTKLCLALVALGLVAGCGGGDKAHDRCTRVEEAICATLVRCHALAGNTVFTSSLCAQAVPGVVDDCVANDGELISAASGEAVDSCVAAVEDIACANLCNQAVGNPPECAALTNDQSTDYISCQ